MTMSESPPDRPPRGAPAPPDDGAFLALLVHHGHLGREAAEGLLARVRGGESLDPLLARALEADLAEVERLRQTRCGEVPTIPGYRLERLLGRGGSADVWAATELATRRPMALKLLRPALTRDPDQLRCFVSEAKLLARIDHPGIVRCSGPARAGETYLMRLERIDGRTLLEHLDEGQVFDESRALAIVLEVARALAHLEAHGLVHRDVKPGNVMLRRDGSAVLIDLGLAARAGSGAVGEHAAGTLAYLSPEEARGAAVADPRSDIYSLGLSLFQLVRGRLPFDERDEQQVRRYVAGEHEGARELRGRDVSPHLQYLIERMTAEEREDRFDGFEELIRELEAELRGRAAFERETLERRPAPRRRRGR
jgi:serine/threonine protein kinase